ncbi:hypothetical protein [Cellulomonas sp. PS-H5]|uniref:hypothetical protein n=1 Tax=Cellulomonas sp. PS-H5 TaxID=2820400 RepID=UPI001C4E33E5|nr:hypothetical protein [Cellulomonas sp. PS-H5]MBW0256067.1 hypothetical protein [Cellulomonas sp. PS-H5]
MTTPEHPNPGESSPGASQPTPEAHPAPGAYPPPAAQPTPGSYPAPGAPQPAAGYPDPAALPGPYPVAPQPAPSPTLAIVGLVTALIPCTALVGLVISIVVLVRGRRGGAPGRGLAVAGVIVGALWLVAGVVALALGAFGVASLVETCADLGNGVHYVDGVRYECNVG